MSKTEPIEYAVIIADLEAKKNALENTLASLRAAQALGALGQSGDASSLVASTVVPSVSGNEVPDGAFHSMSMPAAIKLYLEIVRGKKTAREISDGLKKGGFESTSKFFDKIVYSTLDRLRKSGDVVKIGAAWGLPSWYPALMRAGAKSGKVPDRQTRKTARRNAASEGPKLLTSTPDAKPRARPLKSEPGPSDMIDWFLRDNPGSHTAEEIRMATQIKNLKVAKMLLGTMVKNGRVNKTEDGKYRKAS